MNEYIANPIKEAIAKIQAAKEQEYNESVRKAEVELIAPKNQEFADEYNNAIAKAEETFNYAKTVALEKLNQQKVQYRESVITAIQVAVDEKYASTIEKLEAVLPNE